jgi:uncharacterized membrane protein
MKRIFGIICVLVLSFWMIKPLFINGYFPMHDDTQVARVVVMGKALRQGQFPVRWVSDLGYGYGYPIFNFYSPLPYYIGGSLYAVGIDSVVATKTMFAIGAVIGGISLFLFMESIVGGIGALVAAVLFMYAPYHAIQIYLRGSVGEYWAIAFVPFILLGVRYMFSKRKQYAGILIGSIGISGTLCSHTIIGYLSIGMYLVGLVIYTVVTLIQKKKNIRTCIFLALLPVLGLGLSSFYWLPAFMEMGSTGVSQMVRNATSGFYDHFVCFAQLWNSPWGYGGSAPGCVDGMSLKLGKFQLLVAVLGIILWAASVYKAKITTAKQFIGIGIVVFFISVLGMLGISGFIWGIVPFTSYIQYPWRLLSFSIIAMGICGGFIISVIPKSIYRYIVGGIIIVLCIFINAKLFTPQYIYQKDTKAFETAEELGFTISKISDEYLPPGISKPTSVIDIIRDPVETESLTELTVLERTDTYLKVLLVSPATQTVRIKIAYFPGWIYLVNGIRTGPSIVDGLPGVVVLEGQSVVEARLVNTPVRLLGNIISIISLCIAAGFIFYDKKTNS